MKRFAAVRSPNNGIYDLYILRAGHAFRQMTRKPEHEAHDFILLHAV